MFQIHKSSGLCHSGALLWGLIVCSFLISERAAGEERQFYLGLNAVSAGTSAARKLGVETPVGAVITRIDAGGPAERAGLATGDVIANFAGVTVESLDDLVAIADQTAPGTPVKIAYARSMVRRTTELTVASRSIQQENSYAAPADEGYRLRVPFTWKLELQPQKDLPPAAQYDELRSHEGLHRVRLYRQSVPAHAADAALDAFVSDVLQAHSDAKVSRIKIAGEAAVAVGYGVTAGERRETAYRIAFVLSGRRYTLAAYAPVLADHANPSLVVRYVLGRIERKAGPPSPPPTDQPEKGWSVVTVSNVQLQVDEGWRKSTFSAADEATWFVGDEFKPQIQVQLLRDRDEETLTKGFRPSRTSRTVLADKPAVVRMGELDLPGRKGTMLLVMQVGSGGEPGELAIACFAESERWAKAQEQFHRLVKSVKAVPANAANQGDNKP